MGTILFMEIDICHRLAHFGQYLPNFTYLTLPGDFLAFISFLEIFLHLLYVCMYLTVYFSNCITGHLITETCGNFVFVISAYSYFVPAEKIEQGTFCISYHFGTFCNRIAIRNLLSMKIVILHVIWICKLQFELFVNICGEIPFYFQ